MAQTGSTSGATSGSGSSAGAPETIETGYIPGTATGGAAASNEPIPGTTRALNDSGAFAEASPEKQISDITSFESEFPDDVKSFQGYQEAKMADKAKTRTARKEMAANYGLDPETGEWIPWSDSAGATDNATLANASNSKFEGTTTAYASSNVEDTMVAFSSAPETTEEESKGGGEKYYYGVESEFDPTNRDAEDEGDV